MPDWTADTKLLQPRLTTENDRNTQSNRVFKSRMEAWAYIQHNAILGVTMAAMRCRNAEASVREAHAEAAERAKELVRVLDLRGDMGEEAPR